MVLKLRNAHGEKYFLSCIHFIYDTLLQYNTYSCQINVELISY